MNRPALRKLRRALVIHSGALGDTVLMLRILQAVRMIGAAQVDLLGRGCYRELLVSTGCIDGHLDLDSGGFHKLFSADTELPPAVAESLADYDLVVDMLGDDRSVGRHLDRIGIGRRFHIDPRPMADRTDHITDQWLESLGRQLDQSGFSPPAIDQVGPPTIPLDRFADRRCRAAAESGSNDSNAILLHPGSGSRTKCWPLDHFITVARHLQSGPRSVAFLVGPVEKETFTRDELHGIQVVAEIIEPGDLVQLATIVRAAPLLIGNDSGVSHLAAAIGVPVIAVFGPTRASTWRPLGRAVKVLCSSSDWPTIEQVLDAAKPFTP